MPATSSAPSSRRRTPLSRLPIRLRLAVSVGAVTFLMLTVFGVAVRTLTAHRLRSNFDSQVNSEALALGNKLLAPLRASIAADNPSLPGYVLPPTGSVRIYTLDGNLYDETPNAPNLGPPLTNEAQLGPYETNGYRVSEVRVNTELGDFLLQYGEPLDSLSSEIALVDILVVLGILAGTTLAFVAGWLVARRAIMPIAELTAAAAEIERTGDPSLTLPTTTADDEVAELSQTLQTMLTSLGDARSRTEASLARQRAFVADASHELRTPLTSVLANLELLEDALHGPEREIAQSALRSTQRMRRLVADLLLLARSDVQQTTVREHAADLADLVIAAAAELEPSSEDHEIELDVQAAPVLGSPDDLQRVAINLIENAIRHTPPGTHIRASTRTLEDGLVELVVEDDGPGIAPELRNNLFERFVRGRGEAGGSFGLGLAIVQAVARSHRGTVDVSDRSPQGTRFAVTLPSAPASAAAPAEAVVSSPAGEA